MTITRSITRSLASLPTRVITAAGIGPSIAVPGAPTIGTATAGDGQATVTFTPPASDGGSPITSYTAYSSSGPIATGAASPITVTGLTNGDFVNFVVTATNAAGMGPASASSNAVQPMVVRTLNPADKNVNITLTDGDLRATFNASTGHFMVRATAIAGNTGNTYFETVPSGDKRVHFGIATSAVSLATFVGGAAGSVGYFTTSGGDAVVYKDGTSLATLTGGGLALADVGGALVDRTGNRIVFYRNGVEMYSVTGPAADSFPAISGQITASSGLTKFTAPFAFPKP